MWIGYGGVVAIGVAGADGRDGAPKVASVLGAPNGDAGVGHGDIQQSEQTRVLHFRVALLNGNHLCDLVVEPRRHAEAWAAVITPENADGGLLRGASCLRMDAVAAKRHDLVVSGSVIGTRKI